MPLAAALAPAPGAISDKLVKAYRKLVQKLHLDDLNPESAGRRSIAISNFEAARLQTRISVKSALEKVKATVLETDLRVLWHASKRGARRYWDQQQPATSQAAHVASSSASFLAAESTVAGGVKAEKLAHLTGSNDVFRVAWLYFISKTSEMWMSTLNSTSVSGAEVMAAAMKRPKGQPLITVCNHVGALDDPLIITSILPPEFHANPEAMRWSLCATDRCFKLKSMIPLFRAAKILPISRGGGMGQEGMQAAEYRLSQGDWVHIFPEGTRSRDPESMGPIRKGVGRLVACCDETPLIVPFVHSGMERVQPRGRTIPGVGKEVKVLVGQPIPVEDLLESSRALQWSQDHLYSEIAKRVAVHLNALHAQLKGEAPASVPHEVSTLDLYDPADLTDYQRASMWEKVRFKMEHRAWAMRQWVSAKANKYLEASPLSCQADSQLSSALPDQLGQTPTQQYSLASAIMSLARAAGPVKGQESPITTAGIGGSGVLSLMLASDIRSARNVVVNYTARRTQAVAGLMSRAY